jgi:hypothetical protein
MNGNLSVKSGVAFSALLLSTKLRNDEFISDSRKHKFTVPALFKTYVIHCKISTLDLLIARVKYL